MFLRKPQKPLREMSDQELTAEVQRQKARYSFWRDGTGPMLIGLAGMTLVCLIAAAGTAFLGVPAFVSGMIFLVGGGVGAVSGLIAGDDIGTRAFVRAREAYAQIYDRQSKIEGTYEYDIEQGIKKAQETRIRNAFTKGAGGMKAPAKLTIKRPQETGTEVRHAVEL